MVWIGIVPLSMLYNVGLMLFCVCSCCALCVDAFVCWCSLLCVFMLLLWLCLLFWGVNRFLNAVCDVVFLLYCHCVNVNVVCLYHGLFCVCFVLRCLFM